MKTEDIILAHEKAGACNSDVVGFIESFKDTQDIEIAAIVCSWLSNGYPCEVQSMKDILFNKMHGRPYSYVMDKEYLDVGKEGDYVICGMITTRHFVPLMEKLNGCYSERGFCVMVALGNLLTDRRMHGIKYGHDALASLLGGGTMLPTVNANETFYRYNLMNYYLNYIFNIWDSCIDKYFLLPCNDNTFARAHALGIVNHRMKTSMANAVLLTKKARSVFGERDFYKMYELLNSDAV